MAQGAFSCPGSGFCIKKHIPAHPVPKRNGGTRDAQERLEALLGGFGGGSRRWIDLPVIGRFQPSEFVKIGLIFFFSWFLQKNQEKINRPSVLVTAAVLAALPKGCLIVDLASKPGGRDFAAARRLGHTALHALSLPTVWAPETAGEALARTVQTILQEREGTI